MIFKPDNVFIVADQQRYDTNAALGASNMDASKVDRLVKEVGSFLQYLVAAPFCLSDFSSHFTGHSPQTTGDLANGRTWSRILISDMARAGYRCISISKMRTVSCETRAGVHELNAVKNDDRHPACSWFLDEWDKAPPSHRPKNK